MQKKMMVAGWVVLAIGAISAQAALIGQGQTLDRMHSDSATTLWYASSGGWTTNMSDYLAGLDPMDTESPAIGWQGLTWYEYRTSDAALTLDTVDVVIAGHGSTPGGRIRVDWAIGDAALQTLAPTITTLGESGAGWWVYQYSYDLSGLGADRVRISNTDYDWFTPMFSATTLNVVPEPMTLMLLAMGGVAAIRRRTA